MTDEAILNNLFALGKTQLLRYRRAGLESNLIEVLATGGPVTRRMYSPPALADFFGKLNAGDRAGQLAKEWSRAMHGPGVSDFVAVGDVQIKAIGADGQQMDSEVPVRQMLEQIVAKMGIPPFLLGLSWSSTERMSSQQADMLTSELTAYRSGVAFRAVSRFG